MQQNILDQKDAVLAMMEAQGTATPEEIAEYRADPAKFEEAMSQAFGQMQEIFSDPKALETVVQMMKGFGEIMNDPSAAMSKLGGVLQEALADDDIDTILDFFKNSPDLKSFLEKVNTSSLNANLIQRLQMEFTSTYYEQIKIKEETFFNEKFTI